MTHIVLTEVEYPYGIDSYMEPKAFEAKFEIPATGNSLKSRQQNDLLKTGKKVILAGRKSSNASTPGGQFLMVRTSVDKGNRPYLIEVDKDYNPVLKVPDSTLRVPIYGGGKRRSRTRRRKAKARKSRRSRR